MSENKSTLIYIGIELRLEKIKVTSGEKLMLVFAVTVLCYGNLLLYFMFNRINIPLKKEASIILN
jgi:hypothetical protein